eukprot:CAMPEP_0172514176 /NCGR_PEP_ID=MMETSP1066-20121228/257955_1 /TAXON_ID=671091 /ORGANISM="Coscinodiscus wailesii, Strain CCMP2513" /LENGTH=418 /DNA_ID=CAMNT_0013294729 /DNA_START=205 /DNA_END=1461 /DNA_ORIENTATION=-
MERTTTDVTAADRHKEVSGDVTVCITGIESMEEERNGRNDLPYGFLRVWDGTGPNIVDLHPVTHTTISCHDPSLEVLQSIAAIVNKLSNNNTSNIGLSSPSTSSSSPLEPRMEPPQSLRGRVVNVAIFEENMWSFVTGNTSKTQLSQQEDYGMQTPALRAELSSALRVGQFVRFRNVNDGYLRSRIIPQNHINHGILRSEDKNHQLHCLIVHDKSWITPLPNDTYEISKLLHEHQSRSLQDPNNNSQSAVLPHPNTRGSITPTSSSPRRGRSRNGHELLNLAECIGEPLPIMIATASFPLFYTRFNIKGFCPSTPGDDMVTVFQKRKTLRFVLIVSDDTADLNIIVQGRHAERLLDNVVVCSPGWVERAGARLKWLLEQEHVVMEARLRSALAGKFKYFVLENLGFQKEGSGQWITLV